MQQFLGGRTCPPRGLEMGGRKGFEKSRHRDAKHPVMLRAAAPSASGAPLEKHCQISLTGVRSFWKVILGVV